MPLTRQAGPRLLPLPRPDRPGHWRPMQCAAACIPKAWSPTSSIATSTTPTSAPSTAPSAPSTVRSKEPTAGRRLHPRLREDLREDRRDPGDGRHRRADAGRHPSRPQDRLVRAALHRHQAALSADLAALPVGLRSAGHRGVLRSRACATPSSACAMPASIPSPAAARRFSTTTCATASRASSAAPKTGSACIAPRISSACAPPPP